MSNESYSDDTQNVVLKKIKLYPNRGAVARKPRKNTFFHENLDFDAFLSYFTLTKFQTLLWQAFIYPMTPKRARTDANSQIYFKLRNTPKNPKILIFVILLDFDALMFFLKL